MWKQLITWTGALIAWSCLMAPLAYGIQPKYEPKWDHQKQTDVLFSSAAFCSAMDAQIRAQTKQQIEEHVSRELTANIRNSMIRQIRSQTYSGFINLASLSTQLNGYLSIDKTIASSLGLNGRTLILRSVDELKHLPHTLENQDVLVMVHKSEVINARRAKALVSVAKFRKVKIHFLWHKQSDTITRDRHDLRALFMIATLTGGRVLDLRDKNPCGQTSD